MSDVRRLSNFISRTVSGPMWHGPSLSELLADVTADGAASYPVPTSHSIWEIVLHMASWAEIARRRLGPDRLTDPTAEEDWPTVTEASRTGWQEARNRLFTNYRLLAEDAAGLDLKQLQRMIPGRDHSAQEMLHGLIEHGAYHGGQIAILKRALTHVAATRDTAEIDEH
jgi:uncharacterized damage-inducible protein DinB